MKVHHHNRVGLLLLFCTLLLSWDSCSFVLCANYSDEGQGMENDTTNIVNNEIPTLSHSNDNNVSENVNSHLLSLLPTITSESANRQNDSSDNNDLSNSVSINNRVDNKEVDDDLLMQFKNSNLTSLSSSSSENTDPSLVIENKDRDKGDNRNDTMTNVVVDETKNLTQLDIMTGSSNVTENFDQKKGQEEESQAELAFMQKKVKEMALKGLLEIFGLSSPHIGQRGGDNQNGNNSNNTMVSGPPPEFMVDLYNTVTDSYGVTRAKNPYDAHIVRSLAERDNSLNDFFYFNIPKISEQSETLLEAELHIHRLQTPHEQLHPSLYLTPFYILSLYQVLDPKDLAIPDLHKLLGVHYVPALGSGWEVFNVKQSVLSWMGQSSSGGQQQQQQVTTNHGFLVAATSLGGDRVPVRFSRRGETLHSKQPILVLFTQDSQEKKMMDSSSSSSPQSSSSSSSSPVQRIKIGQQQHHQKSHHHKNNNNGGKGDAMNNNNDSNNNIHGNATQSEEEEDEFVNVPKSSLENPRFHHALLYKDSIRHPNSVNRFRSRRSKNQTESHHHNGTGGGEVDQLKNCSRHDLFVNFEAIGWSTSIIAPKGYNAFYCDGPCSFPIEQEMKPSNHATVQSIVHQLNLSPGVGQPCCVPTTLLPISMLYYDDEDTVVLKQSYDMVAESCGCS